MAGTSFSLSAGQQADGAKAVFLTAIPCQVTVRVHFSIFPPFSAKVMFGSLIKHSFLHPSTIAEPECADHNTIFSLTGEKIFQNFMTKILCLNIV